MENLNALQAIGWHSTQANACEPDQHIVRVVAVDRDVWLVSDGRSSFRAVLAGSYRYHHPQAQEQPCVGDWVCVETPAGSHLAVIQSLLPRHTSLRRKSAGDSVDYQMIAANPDVVVLVTDCQQDFNIRRLERYLVMIADGGAEAVILLTKTDLVSADDIQALLDSMRTAGIHSRVLTLSNVTRDGLDEFMQLLQPQKTYCFVGSSGVGKSTLVNYLLGRERQQTQTVSGTGEGRHTTVRRELFMLDNGALIIDNPGMREFGIMGADSGIAGSYDDILQAAAHCRYRNCTHTDEPGCAVRDAISAAGISQQHFDNYRKISEEADFHDLSYAEKRRKDRDFGKFIKEKKKHIRKK
ncbi:MAG: ribosome small subunit-dependent GTPase A [Pseudomonadota bacterium]|nr:ribosome small subunit-dependent GTPase A [Pseudomonadota bacterium]